MNQLIDLFQARWKGITDLDRETVENTSLDGLAFAVIAFRVEETGGTKLTPDGKKRRKDIFNVEDARVLIGQAREEAVRYLEATNGMEHPVFPQSEIAHTRSLSVLPSVESMQEHPSFEDTSEVVKLGSIHDYKTGAKQTSNESEKSGFKVAKLREESSPAPMEDHKNLGSIRRSDYKGDKILQNFLESP